MISVKKPNLPHYYQNNLNWFTIYKLFLNYKALSPQNDITMLIYAYATCVKISSQYEYFF